MKFEDFKDEVVSLVREEQVTKSIMNANPYYAVKEAKGQISTGTFSGMIELSSHCNKIREINTKFNYDYAAIAVFSMVAKFDKEESSEALYDELAGLSEQETMKFLNDRNLIEKSISIRFEQKNDEEKRNGLVTFIMKDGALGEHVELFDHEVDINQLLTPFGGSFFKE